MRKDTPRVDVGHLYDRRTNVTSEEIKRWLELWPDIRNKVVSNEEAYKELSTLGIRNRDPRTVKTHVERILPLAKTGTISALVDVISFCESRMPVQELIRQLQEKLPIEELAPKLANLATQIANEAPPPDQVIRALGSILAGGSPFDVKREKEKR